MANDRHVFCAALLVLAGWSGRTEAHPHVWVDTVLGAQFEQGRVTALHETWSFDEDFTATVLHDVAKHHGHGPFTPGEIAKLKELAFANLKNSDYFTHVWSAGQPVKVKEATGFAAHLAGDKLVYDFVVPLARPVDPKAGPLRIGIWDDSYYVDVGPAAGTTAHLDGTGAAGCKAAVIEDHDHPLYFGSIFPQTVQITC